MVCLRKWLLSRARAVCLSLRRPKLARRSRLAASLSALESIGRCVRARSLAGNKLANALGEQSIIPLLCAAAGLDSANSLVSRLRLRVRSPRRAIRARTAAAARAALLKSAAIIWVNEKRPSSRRGGVAPPKRLCAAAAASAQISVPIGRPAGRRDAPNTTNDRLRALRSANGQPLRRDDALIIHAEVLRKDQLFRRRRGRGRGRLCSAPPAGHSTAARSPRRLNQHVSISAGRRVTQLALRGAARASR